MRLFGLLLVLFGIASAVVKLMATDVQFLVWVDNWGDSVGWGIRGGCIVLGALLVKAGKGKPKK